MSFGGDDGMSRFCAFNAIAPPNSRNEFIAGDCAVNRINSLLQFGSFIRSHFRWTRLVTNYGQEKPYWQAHRVLQHFRTSMRPVRLDRLDAFAKQRRSVIRRDFVNSLDQTR